MTNRKFALCFVLLLSIAGCRSLPAPSDQSNRDPQAVDDGENRPQTWVRYHSYHIEGNEVPLILTGQFKTKKLVMFGELHGTNEMPSYTAAVISQAARKYKNVFVGLEFPVELQANIEKYMKTGDPRLLKGSKFFNDAVYHSGRGSEAMVGLLNELRKHENIKIFCFDMQPSKKEGRETLMARRILSVVNSLKSPEMVALLAKQQADEALTPIRKRLVLEPIVFVYTGNIHSRLTPGLPGNPNAPTMGSEIVRLSNGELNPNNIMSVLYRFERGTAWNCVMENGHNDCGPRLLQEERSKYADTIDDSRFFLPERELTEGHNYSIFIREVSASNPY